MPLTQANVCIKHPNFYFIKFFFQASTLSLKRYSQYNKTILLNALKDYNNIIVMEDQVRPSKT